MDYSPTPIVQDYRGRGERSRLIFDSNIMKKIVFPILIALGILALPLMAGAGMSYTGNLNFAAGDTTKTITITPDAASANQVWTAVIPIPSWAAVTPASGTFANVTPVQLTVTLNTTGIAAGTYNGSLIVTAGTTGVISVPIAVTVGSGGPPPAAVSDTGGLPTGLSPCNIIHTIRGCKIGMQDQDNAAVCNPASPGIGCTNCSKVGNIGGAGVCNAETCCILDRIFSVADWVFIILMVVAGMFIVWAAFSFVTSGGDAEKVTSARNKITWAIVGIIIAFLSQGFVRIIVQIVSK